MKKPEKIIAISEIIDRLSLRTGIPKRDVKLILQNFIEEITEAAKVGDAINLPGLGVISSYERSGALKLGSLPYYWHKRIPRISFYDSFKNRINSASERNLHEAEQDLSLDNPG